MNKTKGYFLNGFEGDSGLKEYTSNLCSIVLNGPGLTIAKNLPLEVA